MRTAGTLTCGQHTEYHYPKTSLLLLRSSEQLEVFIVCKNPSDCILHAEAPCRSRLSAHHVRKTCQGPSVRKLLSAPRKASQHSASEQRALSHVGSKHFTHPQRLPGSIFEQAGLNVCFRLPTYRDARRHYKAQHMEYPGIPRQASQNNWQFSLSAKILQIASCMQKHLADPDCQRIKTCQGPSVRKLLSAHHKASQHSVCEQPPLNTFTKAAKNYVWEGLSIEGVPW